MFRKIILVLSLILTMGFAISIPATAQGTPASDTPDPDNIEREYTRTFMLDDDATPGASVEIDDDAAYMIMTGIIILGSAEDAQAGVDMLTEGIVLHNPGMAEPELIEDENLGDLAILFHIEHEDAYSSSFLIQDGETVYLVAVTGSGAEAGKEQARALAEFMYNGEIENEDVVFNADGTSTGGGFDLLPTLEDGELISNLPVATDYMHPADGN